jgi:phosphatidate cytidylyltransferase
MKQRIITALIALTLLSVVLFVIPENAALVVIGLVMLAGAWEWSAFLHVDTASVRVIYVAIIAAMIAAVSLADAGALLPVLKVSMACWGLAFLWCFCFPTRIPAAIRWAAGPVVLVPLYAALAMLYESDPMTLLFALLIVWAADSGAFLAGKTLGRVKLAPAISPGKTWEGVLGGLAAVALLTLLRSVWIETDLRIMLPFCLAVACISVVGDLTVSMFKRDSGLKDSGTLFPGHGGVLDRIDSIAAAAPLFVLGLGWVGLR